MERVDIVPDRTEVAMVQLGTQTLSMTITAIGSRMLFYHQMDTLMGGGVNRAIFEHSLEAAAMPLFISGLTLFFSDSTGHFNEQSHGKRRKLILSGITASYIAFQTLNEVVIQPYQHHFNRPIQWEQLGGTAVGLATGFLTLFLVDRITNRFFRPS